MVTGDVPMCVTALGDIACRRPSSAEDDKKDAEATAIALIALAVAAGRMNSPETEDCPFLDLRRYDV